MIAATIACVAACLALMWAEYRAARALRVIAKTSASLAFLAVGVLAGGGRPWMIAGLALGVVGDLALLGASKRWFLAGLGSFWLGHAAYVVGIAELAPPATWLQPLALAPAAVGVAALVYLWPHLAAQGMRGPVIAYVVVIVAMVAGALAAWQPRLTPGAVLFFISDLAVARDTFVARGYSNRVWGLPAYYAGQLLIAWSLAT